MQANAPSLPPPEVADGLSLSVPGWFATGVRVCRRSCPGHACANTTTRRIALGGEVQRLRHHPLPHTCAKAWNLALQVPVSERNNVAIRTNRSGHDVTNRNEPHQSVIGAARIEQRIAERHHAPQAPHDAASDFQPFSVSIEFFFR